MNTTKLLSNCISKGMRRLYLVLLLAMIVSTNINAQVTIGSALQPNAGSILDLKEFNPFVAGGQNSYKGMMLPRVNLVELNSLKPTVASPNATDNGTHVGLIVYNMASTDVLCPGVYTWLGDKWERLYGTCETMTAQIEASYVMEGMDRYFPFTSGTAWTATISDPNDILDESKMALSGGASNSHNFKLQFNTVTDADYTAQITFKDINNRVLIVEVNGLKVFLETSTANWAPDVDAEDLIDAVSTNSIRNIKVDKTAATWVTEKAGTVAGSTKSISASSNATDNDRSGTVSFSLDGLEAVADLKPTIAITQEKMTIDIEIEWILKKPYGLPFDLPITSQEAVDTPLSNWYWGGIAEHKTYKSQSIMPGAYTKSRFFLTTNSKKAITTLPDGLPSWVRVTSSPAFDSDLSKYVMTIEVDGQPADASGREIRTANLKVKVDGGLEKELKITQDKLYLDLLYGYDHYEPTGNIITGNISDLGHGYGTVPLERMNGGYEELITNEHYIVPGSYTFNDATGDYTLQLTPPQAGAVYPEMGTGLKVVYITRLYSDGKGGYEGLQIAIMEMEDNFRSAIKVPVETTEDNPYEVRLNPGMIDNNLEVQIPQKDRDWLDITVDNETNQVQIKTLTLNLTGEDRETEITMVYGAQTRRNGTTLNAETKKVKIIQEAIYLRAEEYYVNAISDGGKSSTYMTTNAQYTALGIEPITVDWVTAKLQNHPATGRINLALELLPNLTSADRTYIITAYVEEKLTGQKITKEITVFQPAMTLDVSDLLWSAKPDGEQKQFTLSTNSYNIITAAPSDSWLTASVTKVSTGNFTADITAEPNRTEVARTATVTIQIGSGPTEGLTKTITVTQAPIELSLNPSQWTVEAAGGTQAVVVTTNSTHKPTATSDGSWLTVVVGSDNNLTLTASSYTNTTLERKAIVTVTVNGYSKTLEVTQKPLAIELTVNPDNWAAPVDGGTQLITATSNHGTITMTSNDPSWLTIAADGKTLVAAANATGTDRTTTVIVSNGATQKTVTVTQKAITVVIDPSTWTVPVGGETKIFSVTTNSIGAPTVSSLPAWIELVTIGADKKVTLKADLNATGAVRTANVTVTVNGVAKTIVVSQQPIKLAVTPATWNAPIGGGTQAVTVDSNYGTVTMTSDQAWLTISGSSMVASANTTGVARTATVTVSNGIAAMDKTIAVTQSTISLTVTPATWEVPVDGGTQALTINSNHGTVTIASNQAWLTISGSSMVAPANATGTDRSATVTVSNGTVSKVVTVTQKAITVVITPATWAAPNVGGQQLFTVTTNSTSLPTITSAFPTWLEQVSNVNKQITLKAAGNLTRADRNASVVVNVNGAQGTITVVQSDVTLVVNPTTWNAPVQGGTQAVSVASNHGTVTMTSNQAWLTISGSSMVASANTTGATRTATVTVSNGIASMNRTIAVTQAAMLLTVTPTSWAAPIQGGSQIFTATTNYGAVTMTSDQAWLTKAADGITFTAAANTTGAARTATITVTNGVAALNKTVTVTQAGMTLTVTPASWAAPVQGGSQIFTATTNYGTVTMTSNQTWLTKGADGKTFTAAANTTGAARTATITVSNGVAALNKTVTVTQAAVTLSVTPTSWAAPIQGGSQVFTATTNYGTVTMTSNQTWLTKAADGKTFTAAANTTGTARTATITVSNGIAALNKTVTVTQAALTLSVTPASWAAPIQGGSQVFTATTNYGTVTMTSNQAWLTKGADGITFTAAANTTGAARTATITVSNGIAAMTKTVTVTQATVTLTVTPASWVAPVNGGSQVFTATTNYGTVTMTSNQTWLTKGTDGKTFTAAANTTGAARTATITVSNGIAALTKTVTVTQAAVTLTVTPASWVAPINGGSQTFTATTNYGTVTMTSNQTWLTKASDGKTFTAAANTTGAARTATITVTNGIAALNKTVTVTQAAITLTVTPTSWTVPVNGGSQIFTATSNYGAITMTSSQAWLIKSSDGRTFAASANTTGAARTAIITVSNGIAALNKTVTVTQAAATLTVTPASWIAPINGGSQVFTATTNYGTVTMTSNQAWLTKAADGKTFTAAANTTAAARTATITVSNGIVALNKAVVVTQAAMTLTVSPTTWKADVDGAFTTITANYSAVTMTSNASWVTVNNSLKRITAAANNTATARTAIVTVRAGGQSKTVTVTQEGLWIKIVNMPTTWTAPLTAAVVSPGSYTVQTNTKRAVTAETIYGANHVVGGRTLNWLSPTMGASTAQIGGSVGYSRTLKVQTNHLLYVMWGVLKTTTLPQRKATVGALIAGTNVRAAQKMTVSQNGVYMTGAKRYNAITGATHLFTPTTNMNLKMYGTNTHVYTWKGNGYHFEARWTFNPTYGRHEVRFTKVSVNTNMWASFELTLTVEGNITTPGYQNPNYHGKVNPWNAPMTFAWRPGFKSLRAVGEDHGVDAPPFVPDADTEVFPQEDGAILYVKGVRATNAENSEN